MALSIIQHSKKVAGSTNSLTFAFTSTPTNGNLMIIVLSLSNNLTINSNPSGWTKKDAKNNTNANTVRQEIWYKVAGASESNSYVFGASGSDYFNAVGYEITGQNTTTPFNQETMSSFDGGGTTFTTPSVTPSVIGCLALGFWATNEGDVQSGPYTNTISSGWTLDEAAHDQFHPVDGGSKNALTTDTSTAISTTFTCPQTLFKSVLSTILIAPAAAASGGPLNWPILDMNKFWGPRVQ